MKRVVGLDLSLTSTGMSDGERTHVVQTETSDGPVEQRLDTVVNSVQRFVIGIEERGSYFNSDADLVVIEGPAFSKASQTGHEELAAVRLMVRHRLWSMGIPFAVVTPTGLKAYTTGNGRATKQLMTAVVRDGYGVDFAADFLVKEGRYDAVDAFALAAMGHAHLGQPLHREGAPARLASLKPVDWPAVPERNPS